MSEQALESQRIIGQVSAQALQDADFRSKLEADPKGVLASHGLNLPADLNVKVLSQFDSVPAVADDPKTLYLMVGATGDQLSHEELSAVAGGGSCQSTASTMFCIPSCLSCSSTASTECG